jgi:hypothetical protein|tara:strand:- start:72 stop:656 length:585 start_codon:yes stop_codon:yes gene_type:complete
MHTDEHLYTITRSEFAKSIGKRRDAVKKDMQRGKYKDLYIFKDGKYFFKSKEAVRSTKGNETIKVYPVKRKINRGNHEIAVKKGNYPNQSFSNHNHMKKMISLRGKLTPEELAMVPEIEARVKSERRKVLQSHLEATRRSPKDYYTKNYGTKLINMSNCGYQHTVNPFIHNSNPLKFVATNRGSKKPKKGPYEI